MMNQPRFCEFPIRPAFALALCLPVLALAQKDQSSNDTEVPLKPVMEWRFDDRDEAGPRAPRYPGFPADNTAAVSVPGKPVDRVSGATSPRAGDLRFGLGDEITLEAWVKVRSIGEGAFVYVLGKGRLDSKAKNQNYALRVAGAKGAVKLNFLFSSDAANGKPGGWHRWTSSDTFSAGSWHHVAVTYEFGKKDSLKGYIDGKPVAGVWDMDGATDRAPSNDEDDLVLGTGNGDGSPGKTGNALDGWMDNVAIWRVALPAATLADRYAHVPPPPVVDRGMVPEGRVLVQICEEGIPEKATSWPEEPPPASETYLERALAFFEQPHRYIDSGVRGQRANPHLMRAAATVELPKGRHRLLLRARGGTRLYIDDELVLTTPFNTRSASGHGRVKEQDKFLDLGPDFRFAPPGNYESTVEFESSGGPRFVVMETLVGGVLGRSFRRPELGETVVAWSPEGSESWFLLSPAGETLPYTDAGWEEFAAERREHLVAVNATARAAARESQASYWEGRRAAARDWLAATLDEPVPALPPGMPAHNEIDHFLGQKIAAAAAELDSGAGRKFDFYRDVQPLLEAKCLDCHQGGKAKGDLQLDGLAAALRGGESDGPAVVPGHPERSSIIARVTSDDEDEIMPPKGKPLTSEETEILRTWIAEGAHWPALRVEKVELTELSDDLTFLRRLFLDTVGVPPTLEDIAEFEKKPDRGAWIDRMLADPRWADHWTSYWQDVLAENPNILNPTLNNTGPFRWWIHESFLDNKPLDLFVTELLRMEGSERYGGPAGFAVASQNDVPMAEKGMIVAGAFLGVEMKCARCHDAPAHEYKQEDLFSIAAMLKREEIEVPASSSVPMDRFHEGGRKPLIQVTLQPGAKVQGKWPFPEFCDDALAAKLAREPENPRDALAALVTAPQNERFAQVMANRLWTRLMGAGIVANVADWEKAKPSHPGLMRWLGRELVRSGYDMKALARLILNSHAFQRAVDPELRSSAPLFTAPAPRRLDAEQIVDSLFAATGKSLRTEEASLDIDGGRDERNSISLGHPTRSWMLTSTSNERDRPALSLPRIQAMCDVLEAFAWRGARQDPVHQRPTEPNTLQPAILSNGTVSTWLTVLSDDHGITRMALEAESPEELVERMFLRLLTRRPDAGEKARFVAHLEPGFKQRKVDAASPVTSPEPRRPRRYVTWTNHLDPEATVLRQREEVEARRGDPPTGRLDADWRGRLEDTLWSLLNAPEWVFAP